MEQHISFYKIYIVRFADFDCMLNKNSKQNIVNSMWTEDLKGSTYTRSDTNVLLNILPYSPENTCVLQTSGLQLY